MQRSCPPDCTCGRHTQQLWSDDPARNRKGKPASRRCAPGCTCLRHVTKTQIAAHREMPTESKVCTSCGIEKPRSEYYENKQYMWGLTPACKTCAKERQNKYRGKFNLTLEQLAALKMSGQMERCKGCNIEQLKCNFYYETGARRRDNLCLTCGRDQLRRDRAARPEAHRKHHRQSNASQLAKKHDLTQEELAELRQQLGRTCNVCDVSAGDVVHGLSLDHDHVTAEVRGFLCGNCNTALGKAGDSVKRLQQLIAYLRNPPARKLRLGKNILTLSA